MYRCDRCGKEVRSESGLKRHMNGCVVEEVLDSLEDTKVVEVSDNVAIKIKKLRDARKSTWDAEARHNIDLQIKELEGN